MVDIKDEINQFKRDLRSYTYRKKKVAEIDEKLLELSVQQLGVSSPAPKKVIYENAGDPYHNNKLSLMMREEELINERMKHQNELDHIDKALNSLPPAQKQVLIDVYITRERIDTVADRNHCSIRKMKYDIDEMIKKIL